MPEPRTLPELMQAARAFQESRVLLTALELDVLPACGDGAGADQVAAAAGCDPRATGMLLNALAALGVLAKEGGRYRCTEAGRGPGPAAGRADAHGAPVGHLVHPHRLRADRDLRPHGPPGGQVEDFIAAMHARARTVTGGGPARHRRHRGWAAAGRGRRAGHLRHRLRPGRSRAAGRGAGPGPGGAHRPGPHPGRGPGRTG